MVPCGVERTNEFHPLPSDSITAVFPDTDESPVHRLPKSPQVKDMRLCNYHSSGQQIDPWSTVKTGRRDMTEANGADASSLVAESDDICGPVAK